VEKLLIGNLAPMSSSGRYAKLCITAIMTSVLLCTVR
jgi:hypothetical protein